MGVRRVGGERIAWWAWVKEREGQARLVAEPPGREKGGGGQHSLGGRNARWPCGWRGPKQEGYAVGLQLGGCNEYDGSKGWGSYG